MLRSRWTWIGIGILIVVVMGIVTAQFVISSYLSPAGISSQLSSALDRHVVVNSVDVSLWSGLQLRDITVSVSSDPDSQELLTVQLFSLKPSWWELLGGTVRITSGRLRGPVLNLERSRDGEWNVTGRSPGVDSRAGSSTVARTNNDSSSLLEIRRLTVEEGQVNINDRVNGFRESMAFEQIRLDDFVRGKSTTVRWSGVQFPGSTLNGQVGVDVWSRRVTNLESQLNVDSPGEFHRWVSSFQDGVPSIEGGQYSLTLQEGSVSPESAKATVQFTGTGNSVQLNEEQVGGWELFQWGGRIEVDPTRLSGGLTLSGGQFRGVQTPNVEGLNVDGNIDTGTLSLSPADLATPWAIESTLSDITIDHGKLADVVELDSVSMTGSSKELTVEIPSARSGDQRASGRINTTMPPGLDQPISGRVRMENGNVAQMIPWIPAGVIPEGVDLEGRISLPKLTVSGTPRGPELNGTINIDRLRSSHDLFSSPVIIEEESVGVSGHRLLAEEVDVRFLSNHAQIRGEIDWRESVTGQATVQFDSWPTEVVEEAFAQPRKRFGGYQPGGTVSGTVEAAYDAKEPTVAGNLRFPRWNLGPWEGRNGSVITNWAGDRVTVDSLETGLFGGRLSGEGHIAKIWTQPAFEGEVSGRAIGVESLLTTLGGTGDGSDGQFNGSLSLRGTVETPLAIDGGVSLGGDSIVLRNLPALNRLDRVLTESLTDAIGQETAVVLRSLFDESVSEFQSEIRRVFRKDVTGRFREVGGAVQFTNGEGVIRRARAINDYLKIQSGGRVWTDGRINLDLTIDVRKPLVERARSSTLRRILEVDFPPLSVGGTVSEPDFGTDTFQRELVKNWIRSRLFQKEESNGDGRSPGRELLEGLFR